MENQMEHKMEKHGSKGVYRDPIRALLTTNNGQSNGQRA